MRELSEQNRRNRRAYMREYRLKNLERILEKNRAYYWSHREQMLAYGKAYREKAKANMTEKDREEEKEYRRILYQLNKEKKKAQPK